MLWMVTLIPHEAYAGGADFTDGCDHHANSMYFQLLSESRPFSSSWLQMCMFFCRGTSGEDTVDDHLKPSNAFGSQQEGML